MKFYYFIFRDITWFKGMMLSIFMFAFILCQAQSKRDWEAKYLAEFEDKEKVESIVLAGYFNKIFYTEIRLLHDDEIWLGEFYFPNEQLKFILEGGIVDSFLLLIETDPYGRESGLLKIDKQLEKYHCEWYNNAANMDHHFDMLDQQWNPLLEKKYSQEFNSYKGYIGQKPYDLIIQNKIKEETDFSLFNRLDKRFEDVDISCINSSCNKFKLTIIDQKTPTYFGVNESDGISLFRDFDEEFVEGKFSFDQKKKTDLLKKINNNWMLSVEFPVLANIYKNTGLYSTAQDIFNDLQVQLDELSKDEDLTSRWRFYAHAWMEIEHWDDKLISGRWIIQKSWNNDIECISFNFLLDKKEALIIKEEFRDDFDFEFYLAQFIEDQRNHMPEFKDPLLRNRLQKAKFTDMNVNAAGIMVKSDYNTIFGSFEMLIPSSEIMQYLRKKSKLKAILN